MSPAPAIAAVPLAPHAGPSLGDLLAACPALAGARLIPSDASLTTTVSAIVLADAAAPPEPGCLVLAAGSPPASPPRGAVAVVCRTPPSGDVRVGVPVVLLPENTSWGTVIAELAAALFADPFVAHASRAREALTQALVEGLGYAGLAEVASGLVGAPVAVVDEYLDLLGAAGGGQRIVDDLDRAIEAARRHGPASVLGAFMDADMPGVVRRQVRGPRGVAGVVCAWLGGAPAVAQDAALDELTRACAVEGARDEARVETEARLRGDLIEELLVGEVIGRESLVRRARHLGADLSRGAVAMIGRLQDPHTEGRAITEPRVVRRFLTQARGVIDLHRPGTLVDWNEGVLHALLPTSQAVGEAEGGAAQEAAALTLAKRLLAATRETVPGLSLTLALSRHTPEPERLGQALDEAQLALSIGERLGRIGDVVTFEETGTYKLLFQVYSDRPEELRSFYEQTLARLVAYDEQYQTDLVHTLATYLGHDGNLAATAATLFTHRHTVRYRLDRIAELSGLDISKTDDRERLSLGLKAMRLLGRTVHSAPDERPSRPRRG